MEIFTLLTNLEELLEAGKELPFSSKVVVDKEEIQDLIEDIRIKIPEEMKQAKWVKEERQKIILDAQKEAEEIKKEAENQIVSMINDHEITRQAIAQKNEIVETANTVSKEISEGTRKYADSVLENLEGILSETLNVVRGNRKELK